jgi:uncharacterized protein YjiS (DUF1127 family)
MMSMNAATLTEQLNAHARATRSISIVKRPGLLRETFMRWRLWSRIRRDEAWLRRQPDYLLRDVGLERTEIRAIVRQGRFF